MNSLNTIRVRFKNNSQFLIEDQKVHPTRTDRGFDARKHKCLRGLKPAHVDMIEALQPYNGVEWTKTLRDISNPDKHRTLTVLTHERGLFHITADFHGMEERKGVIVPGVDNFAFKIDASYAITIAPPEPGKPALLSLLRRLQMEVCGTIERFAPAFLD